MSMGIGIGALSSLSAAIGIWLFTAGSAYVGARKLYQRTVRKRTEELQGLFTSITEHLQTALDEAALPAPRALEGMLPPARED
jgi:hypothetical protein